MDYTETVLALSTLFEVPISQEDENFARILPRAFEYANNRIYRDLRHLTATVTVSSTATIGNRETALPSQIIVLHALDVIGITGARRNLERISIEALNIFWPDPTFQPGQPRKYAIIGTGLEADPYLIRLMPTPDLAYVIEYTGIVRPAPLSQTNTQTYLSVFYPDLHVVACAVFLSGYQRDFGLMNAPQGGTGWEDQYSKLVQSALIESRQLHAASDWFLPPDLVQPPPPSMMTRSGQ